MSLRRRIAGTTAAKVWRGVLDYARRPELRESWGGPMNGQPCRRALVRQVFREMSFAAVIETGTYRGTTTRFLAEIQPAVVWTIEKNPEWFGFAWTRFALRARVRVRLGDSRVFLSRVIEGARRVRGPLFIYLDAHWGEDLPLIEELRLVFAHHDDAIVLIDDFRVPDDDGYGYDIYGELSLTRELLRPVLSEYGLVEFYPAVSSRDEGGARRGCVFLVRPGICEEMLGGLKGLRRHRL